MPKNNAAKSLIELMYKQGYISSSRETILGMKIYTKKIDNSFVFETNIKNIFYCQSKITTFVIK